MAQRITLPASQSTEKRTQSSGQGFCLLPHRKSPLKLCVWVWALQLCLASHLTPAVMLVADLPPFYCLGLSWRPNEGRGCAPCWKAESNARCAGLWCCLATLSTNWLWVCLVPCSTGQPYAHIREGPQIGAFRFHIPSFAYELFWLSSTC